MIKRSVLSGLMVVLVLCLATADVAEAQSLTGDWDFTVSIPALCTWGGVLQFTQTGTALASTGTLVLAAGGDPTCPPVLPGATSGTVTGQDVAFGTPAPPPIGSVDFVGQVATDGLSMSGTWAAAAGTNLGGTWSASRMAAAPTLPEWGAILMLALLLGAGVLALRRRQQQMPL